MRLVTVVATRACGARVGKLEADWTISERECERAIIDLGGDEEVLSVLMSFISGPDDPIRSLVVLDDSFVLEGDGTATLNDVADVVRFCRERG